MGGAARVRDLGLPASQRRDGGVVHTPPALARAMVREADALLGRHGLPRIGARALRVLDPATGPGVFLAAVMAHARGDHAPLVGVDVDADASARTRRALARMAGVSGYRLRLETRDALSAAYTGSGSGPDSDAGSGSDSDTDSDSDTGSGSDSDSDSDTASTPALLVLGNPPWSARGRGPAYVESLLSTFHLDEHGAPLGERRRGVLADAYVRFLRWAIDAVERAPGGGALALVTNSSYLDGPVHRGLRAALLARFDEVSVIDLGGSALVARAPGTVDGNVFGVRPGVAILLAARRPARSASAPTASLRYRALEGAPDDKLAALSLPGAPFERVERAVASFRPRRGVADAYARWPSLAEWLPFHAEGVQTNRDAFVIDRDREALLARLGAIAEGRELPPARGHFDPREASRALAGLVERGELASHLRPLAYRPFDERLAFLHPALCHRPRPALLRAMACSTRALVSVRQDRGSLPWAHSALVRAPIDNCYLSARSSCRARAFPSHSPDGAPNVASVIVTALDARGIEAAPGEVLAFLAAVLSSRGYAERFGPALALDYPRVPLPREATLFASIASHGEALERALARSAEPVTGRAIAGSIVRVGHHGFDPGSPAPRALAEARAALEDDVLALLDAG